MEDEAVAAVAPIAPAPVALTPAAALIAAPVIVVEDGTDSTDSKPKRPRGDNVWAFAAFEVSADRTKAKCLLKPETDASQHLAELSSTDGIRARNCARHLYRFHKTVARTLQEKQEAGASLEALKEYVTSTVPTKGVLILFLFFLFLFFLFLFFLVRFIYFT